MTLSKISKRVSRGRTRVRWLGRNFVDRVIAAPKSAICPVCESEHQTQDLKPFVTKCKFGGGQLVRYQCSECDLVFGTARMLAMGAEELGREYVDLYKTYSESDATDSEIRVFRAMQPKLGGRYLNYGCGRWSESVPRLREEGYDVYGYEPFVQDGPNLPSYILTRPDQLCDLQFDGIMSHNFIEHLQDPAAMLRELDAILAPGGSMVHATPCYEYAYEFTRFHLVFFLGRSIETLAARCGFRVEDIEHLPGDQLLRTFHRVTSQPA